MIEAGKGKPTLKELDSLEDPLLSCNFRVLFLDLPSGFLSSLAGAINGPITWLIGAGRSFFGTGIGETIETDKMQILALRCRSASIAPITVEQVTVEHKGYKAQYSGRITQEGTVTLEFLDDQRQNVLSILRAWMVGVRSLKDNKSEGKSGYAGKMSIIALKQDGAFNSAYIYDKIWPQNIGEISFSGSSPEIVVVSCTFAYDVCYFDPQISDRLSNAIF